MTTVLLDTHVLQWWSAEPDKLSSEAIQAISNSDELAVAGVTWFELAWLAAAQRLIVTLPIRTWLQQLSEQVRTVGITPAIAHAAVSLPSSFRGDPADRIIFGTAIESGLDLVTKDPRLRSHRHPRPMTIW